MFKKLLEARNKKAALVAEMRSLMDKAEQENRSLSEEEAGKFDGLKSEVEEVKEEIERLEAVMRANRPQSMR